MFLSVDTYCYIFLMGNDMKNEYGLDVSYFERKLKLVVRDISMYTPSELFRELSELSLVAADQADMTVEIKTLNDHRHK